MPSGSSRDWLGCIIDSFFCNVSSNKVNYQMYSKQQKIFTRKIYQELSGGNNNKNNKKKKRWRKLAGRNVIKVCCNTLKENESDSPRPNIIKNLLYMTIMYCISPHQQWSNSSCLYWMSVTLACSSEPFLPLLKTLLQPLKWGSERIMKRVIFSMGVQLTWVVAYESVPVLW